MFSNYGTDVSDVEAKVIGLHYKFASLWGMSWPQGFTGCWQDGTDVGAPGDIEGAEVPFYQYASMNSESLGVSRLWEALYSMINSANIIINTEGVDPAAKGEAQFFRAYCYNLLVTLWGPVPLLTESKAEPRTDFVRNSVEEIDAVIFADLNDAMANLPEVGKTKTQNRINKDCARILAGEAFNRMGKYAEAESAVSATIASGNYKLISERYGKFLSDAGDYYSDMFRWGNQRRSQGNTEGIWVFQMEFNRDVTGGTIDAPQQRRNWVAAFHKIDGMVNADSLGGRGNGRLRLSNYVKYGVYQEGDIRNSNHNIRRILYYNRPNWSSTIYVKDGYRVDEGTAGATALSVKTGDRVYCRVNDTLNVLYPHTTKWGGYDTTDDFGWSLVKDWPLMRLADAYLLRAEARIQQGNTAGAAEDINVLRDRAFKQYRTETGNATAGAVTASEMTMDFLLDERIRELVGEENRRYTLCRTGKLADRVKMMMDKWAEGTDSKKITGFNASTHCLLPIPLSEIQLNKDAELQQNPGY
ncbi:MAG: RagB/SusD family nutrient uptake outer membrane protein [Prevotella sp.]|nr:RagB/SusD family nutrient uptake outer membrane protein [Prevotella sp.]